MYIIYICTGLLYVLVNGGSVGQPPLAPDERAVNQPKPRPSDRIV